MIEAGYKPGENVYLALDVAASELWNDGAKRTSSRSPVRRRAMPTQWSSFTKTGCGSTRSSRSRTAWPKGTGTAGRRLTSALGDRIQLVGDDVFVTNPEILARGIREKVANSILVKLNQIGTVTETLDAVAMARDAGYTSVISHRSGETEDTTIADLAVATSAGQIKTGSASRSDRVAKYNQLLRIEEELGAGGSTPGEGRSSSWRSAVSSSRLAGRAWRFAVPQ